MHFLFSRVATAVTNRHLHQTHDLFAYTTAPFRLTPGIVAEETSAPASMRGWWNREGVRLHLRSTSVGDVLADEGGNLFVVENTGFRPYRPRAIRPDHRLAEAYRLLDEASARGGTNELLVAAHQAQNAILYLLEAEGCLNGELPIVGWADAEPGDLVGGPCMGKADSGLFRFIARRLRPKWRAKRLLAHTRGRGPARRN